MSNQRAGKTHKAALSDGSAEMRLRDFFRTAQQILESEGYDDAAFYFEQVKDHLNDGGTLPTNRQEIVRLLGV